MYYLYKTTNLINGKYYIGVHYSQNIQNDSYLGSGKALHLTFISKNNLDIIEDNKDVISKYFKKYFDDIYDRPIWSSTKSPNRSTLFSSGTLGGMAWLYPHFQQFADDVSKLLTKELYK